MSTSSRRGDRKLRICDSTGKVIADAADPALVEDITRYLNRSSCPISQFVPDEVYSVDDLPKRVS